MGHKAEWIVKDNLNSPISDKVDITELSKLGAGLKKVIMSFTLAMWNFACHRASREVCQGGRWLHEVRA